MGRKPLLIKIFFVVIIKLRTLMEQMLRKKIKPAILVVYDDIPGGGSLSLVIHLIKRLTPYYDFYLLTGVYPGQSIQKLISLKIFKKIFTYKINFFPNEFIKFLYVSQHTKILLREIDKNYKFDFLILNFLYSAFGVIYSKLYSREKIIHFVHQIFFLYKASIIPQARRNLFQRIRIYLAINFYRLLQSHLLKFGKVVCFSSYTKDMIGLKLSRAIITQFLTVPFDYISEELEKKEQKIGIGLSTQTTLILYASRIEPHKGLHLLMDAINMLKTDKDLTFLLIGPYYFKASSYFLNLLTQIKQRKNIHLYYAGEVENDEMTQYYQAADLTIMPTTELETFGMVTLEALANQSPVVCFPSGATQKIIKKINKNLVAKSMKARDLAKAITFFLALNFQERKDLHRKSWQLIKKEFNFDNTLSEFNEILYENPQKVN